MYFHDDDDDDLDWMSFPRGQQEQTTRAGAAPPCPAPSQETMEKRWAFRQSIREQTLHHRRIQLHGGMGDTGRNIALVLRDRETRGAQHTTRTLPRGGHTQSQQVPPRRRSMTYPMSVFREVQIFAEYSSVVRYHSSYLAHLFSPITL